MITAKLIFMKKAARVIMVLCVVSGFISCGSKQENSSKKADVKSNNTSASPQQIKTILFFGNSLTAGYGLDPAESFPTLIQVRLDSMHLFYKAVNAGVSGETSAGGNGRIDWILKQPVDVFMLEL